MPLEGTVISYRVSDEEDGCYQRRAQHFEREQFDTTSAFRDVIDRTGIQSEIELRLAKPSVRRQSAGDRSVEGHQERGNDTEKEL